MSIPAIEKAAWQPVLFAEIPRRREIARLKTAWPCRPIHLRVHRNTPFEYIAGVLPAFLAYADLESRISLSDYDDSLAFSGIQEPADCELIWLDFDRYTNRLNADALIAWLAQRLRALRGLSEAPILIADSLEAPDDKLAIVASTIPGCRIVPRRRLKDQLGSRWSDERMTPISASAMSDEAIMATARLLGLVWIPAAVSISLKAVVLDLDQTLYDGVLGEDGSEGIHLSEEHRALQAKLLDLKRQGVFLALLSRNEPADVDNLFATRGDFPLKQEDFSAVSIGWGPKSLGLQNIADQLRIHPDAMLALDDNLGEIATMAQSHLATSFWQAADPQLTLRALDFYPRLLRWNHSETDLLRTGDMKAAKTRAATLANFSDPAAYAHSLAIRLGFFLNPRDLAVRLTDLANKTNQFVLALARLNETEVAKRLSDPRCATIAVSLADRLSDSGVIAGIFCRAGDDTLIVDEICISCRALGRQVEDFMVLGALDRARQKFGSNRIAFVYDRGPRNKPARDWLEKLTGYPLTEERGRRVVEWAELCHKIPDLPVDTSWNIAEEAA